VTATADRLTPAKARAARPRRVRRPVWLAAAVVVAALGWVAVKGLTGSLVYYLTPTDIAVKHQAAVGERVRLGGLVLPGTVRQQGNLVRFTVSDGTTRMRVVDTGGVPSLFRANQGVVVEGVVGAGVFRADTVLVKHSGVYRPPVPGHEPRSARLSSGG
jgi:cytochrome c-type biogenesis protein CcmE